VPARTHAGSSIQISASPHRAGKRMNKWANAVPSRAEQQDTKRKAIIREAGRVFNRRGSHGTTLEDVAERLGVTRPLSIAT